MHQQGVYAIHCLRSLPLPDLFQIAWLRCLIFVQTFEDIANVSIRKQIEYMGKGSECESHPRDDDC